MTEVWIVVPCYNEAERLDRVAFERFLAKGDDLNLVFVDDGSTDGTLAVLGSLEARHPDRATVLSMDRNQGKAEAVRQGMTRAMDRGARLVGFWDADLSTPLEYVGTFVSRLDESPGTDVVIGSRVRMLGRDIQRFGARHLVGRAFATIASFVLALPVYDTQCGAKIFRGSPELRRALDLPFRSRWSFDVELLQRLQIAWGERGIDRIVEFPLLEWHDFGGSKVSLRQGGIAFLSLLRLAFRGSRRLPVQSVREATEDRYQV